MGLKEIYLAINEAKKENKSKLYDQLLQNVTRITQRKEIANYLVSEKEDNTYEVLLGKQFDMGIVQLVKE